MATKSRFPQHSRVALKDGADSMYQLALPNTEGWVRDHKTDDDGFEMVAIEWDQDHWRYNGEPDGWTFADHFRLIGPPDPPLHQLEVPVEQITDPRPSDDEVEGYIDTITDAMDAASESQGFLMVTIRRVVDQDDPSQVAYIPQIFHSALTNEAEALLDVQLMEMVSATYQQMALTLLEKLKREQ